MKIFKAAIIGFGNIGYYYSLDRKRKKTWSHFEAFEKIRNTKTIAIVEINKKKRFYIKKKFPKIKVYSQLEDLLSDRNDIDIFAISSPTKTHYSILKKLIAVKAKIIICEKPICSNILQAKKIYSQLINKGITSYELLFSYALLSRNHSEFKLAKELLILSISKYPTQVDHYILLAEILRLEKDFSRA